ncbi:HEPN domain-containing protein [Epilithonimonas ginsengisoli]|uniref:HEPN domain-containing protein n=1 Tax=Epilithonimonas ginsengisoli TaxID=1245592 RepID=A0ABU4JEQ9_9FLAO|nr:MULTISPECIES: lysozyme inhibitor LprI family protein [Chryseobacterium group]MBV6879520.1 DUF1311 domain-containing protein [Epilithonimonas sp. FP105]MDW8548156.1 HEPN domain-containing protein [Epilithonimonas ginsengisoli]OAH64409.1 hypothetical protein AXA65_18790 [Chryseobacterium sp. FP211-J200]
MKKRDFIQEIKLIKSRTEFNSRYDLTSRLYEIDYALNEFTNYNGDYNSEILKYIPISTVACFEAFFKSVIKEVVDFGEPYNKNIANFNQSKNIKLDFEIIGAIQTKSVTVGELIGHLLPFNNFEDINSNLSVILGRDFLDEMKNFKKESVYKTAKILNDDKRNRLPEIIQSVKETYELRHIFCHEFATNIHIDKDKIIKNYQNCKDFLEFTNTIIWKILYPDSPETQTDMNHEADMNFKKKDDELQTLIDFIIDNKENIDEQFSIDFKLFKSSIEKWKKYRETVALYKANNFKGGSMYPLIYLSALENTTTEKIESLKNEFEILLRKNNYN